MLRGGIAVILGLSLAFMAYSAMNQPVQSQAAYVPVAASHADTSEAPTYPEHQPLRLIFPTSNIALLFDDGPAFFQYTDRYFEGQRSRPWQGGQYGFVRNPKRSAGELIYTRFHEGVDIRPLYRDRNGEPLDTVRTIDDGKVVYVNDIAGASSYGKYVVIEHWWSDSPFYSLYAHLGRVDVREGQRLAQGERIGRIGYTGRGINKRRAHLHFEINMLLNSDYDRWHRDVYRAGNRHGIYNGLNLAGLDVAELYREMTLDADLTISDFVRSKPAFYGVVMPNDNIPDILLRYPWLLDDHGPASDDPPAWEFHFTASGFPIAVRRAYREVDEPRVSMVVDVAHPYDQLTIGRLSGAGGAARLSARGVQYMSLMGHREDGTRTNITGP